MSISTNWVGVQQASMFWYFFSTFTTKLFKELLSTTVVLCLAPVAYTAATVGKLTDPLDPNVYYLLPALPSLDSSKDRYLLPVCNWTPPRIDTNSPPVIGLLKRGAPSSPPLIVSSYYERSHGPIAFPPAIGLLQ
eukprot:1661079-Pyramimonas_sp.AAC.1